MKLLSTLTALGASTVLAAPPAITASTCENGTPTKCCPVQQSGTGSTVGPWTSFPFRDPNNYYAVSLLESDFNGGIKICQEAGGKLAEIYGENMDVAVYDTILNSPQDGYTEYLMSARYFTTEDTWLWCPLYADVTVSKGCNSEMTWVNWSKDAVLGNKDYNCQLGLINNRNKDEATYREGLLIFFYFS